MTARSCGRAPAHLDVEGVVDVCVHVISGSTFLVGVSYSVHWCLSSLGFGLPEEHDASSGRRLMLELQATIVNAMMA